MQQTVDNYTPSTTYGPVQGQANAAPPRREDISMATENNDHLVRGTSLMLTTAGGAAGAAFLGGTLAGPIGVVGGAAVGVILGFLIKKFTA